VILGPLPLDLVPVGLDAAGPQSSLLTGRALWRPSVTKVHADFADINKVNYHERIQN